MRHLFPLALFGVLAACSATSSTDTAFAPPPPSGDELTDSALLLAASEQAPDASARAPLLARLDAAGVQLAEGASDDPLGGWREESAALGKKPVFRGRALGPAYRRARLAPGEKLELEQVFLAGERAEIAAAANGSDKLHLAVRDKSDKQVCSTEFAPSAKCRWLPIYTERYEIELENRGSNAASVYLVVK